MPLAPPAAPTRPKAEALSRLLRRLNRFVDRAERTSASFTRWRLAIFLAGAALSVIAYKQGLYHLGNGLFGTFILLFAIVARYHTMLEDRIHRLRAWRAIKQTHVARIGLDWAAVPARLAPVPENHAYAKDLDIAGPHSLFHLLNTTCCSAGRERLASWLLHQTDRLPPPDVWQARQTLVKELSGLRLFCDRLALTAQPEDGSFAGHNQPEIDCARIQTALDHPAGFAGLRSALLAAGFLSAATLTLGLGAALALLPNYWLLPFAAYAALQLFASGLTAQAFSRVLSLQDELRRISAVFLFLERRRHAGAPSLHRLCAPLAQGPTRPSASLAALAATSAALSLRAHPLVHFAVNALAPWDLFFTWRLERLRLTLQRQWPTWLDILAEVDAAAALGTFANLHPHCTWPKPLDAAEGNGQPAAILAHSLGHPLLPDGKRIANDLRLEGLGRILLITGSNMSGKSTFLRTVGINVCLAQAGAPVCAASFEWSWMRIACCIRVDDSLEAGLSYFYAEVKRLKRLLDAAGDRSARPILFLIDEIFKGTNNRERLAGSKAFIHALAESNGLGLVTTHDLELAQMERELPAATNVHFQETVEAKALTFDYRLRPGPCPTTNALRIMALEGLPVSDKGA